MFYVYILKIKLDGRFYKGLTNNLERRINEHNMGRNKSTKAYLPWELVFLKRLIIDLMQEKKKSTLKVDKEEIF